MKPATSTGYSIFRGWCKPSGNVEPIERTSTPDFALLRAKKFAKEDKSTFVVCRDGADWATVHPDGDVKFTVQKKEGRA